MNNKYDNKVSWIDKGSIKKMCMKLSELNGLSANELLKKAGQDGIVPVDIAQLCYDLQIIIKPFDFASIESSETYRNQVISKGNILGVVLAQGDDLAILYREADTKNRKRFTLAHELAHCCLHMSPQDDIHVEFRIDGNSDEQKEVEANIFAGELLIPEDGLKSIINETKVEREIIPSLASLFAVSINVMEERLKYLKIEII